MVRMSRLVTLIDNYRDKHGQPSEASIARAIGVAPQTISSWRTRGIKAPPDSATLRALAHLIGEDYVTVVLDAALHDAGWLADDEASAAGAS